MPELPEVYIVSFVLETLFKGDTLSGWQRFSPRLRCQIPSEKDARFLLGAELLRVRRVAKAMYLDFGFDLALHVHLGMTGHFVLASASAEKSRHEHLRLEFESGRALCYCDPRRFGVVNLREIPEKNVPEPFVGELNVEYLAGACRGSQRSIKSLIMDQHIIAGPGNIYACEALLLAGIRPDRPANSLDESELRALSQSLIQVIGAAVESGLNYQRQNGPFLNSETTHFPVVMNVYGRAGKICLSCGTTTVKNIKIAGRSSFFCPSCQK